MKPLFYKHLVINGKKRKIITYANNYGGYQLRKIHELLNKSLSSVLPVSPYSYAYVQNRSALQCIEQHKNSTYFFKFDIHDFFNSMKLNKMKMILKCHLSDNPDKAYLASIINNKKRAGIHTTVFQGWSDLTDLLQLCYVNNSLPLGLVTSPELSNLFLYFFDNRFHNNFPDLIYTRYHHHNMSIYSVFHLR